jgi:hypothetical protein
MAEFLSFDRLAERVDALERQSLRLKRQLFAALVGLLCLGTVSATTASQRTIAFSGPKGTVRIDAMGVHFLTPKGKENVLFGYTNLAKSPAVWFKDSDGVRRMYVGLTTESDGFVGMYNSRGIYTTNLAGDGELRFYDDSGSRRMYVGTTKTGTGIVRIFNGSEKLQTELADDFLRVGDSTGTERGYIGVTTTNEPALKLWDSNHTERTFVGVSTENTSMVQLFDAGHTERNFMGTYSDGTSGVTAYNSSGTSIWSSP